MNTTDSKKSPGHMCHEQSSKNIVIDLHGTPRETLDSEISAGDNINSFTQMLAKNISGLPGSSLPQLFETE